jgi:hypothetical protein
MRLIVIGLAALVLSACGPDAAQAPAGCARSATHEVAWTNGSAPDVIMTRAEGPTCAQAIVTFVARTAQGDPLWAFASTYYDMTAGGRPPDGVPAVSDADMDRFLVGWANVTEMRSGALPEWRADAPSLTASAQTFSYDTPFEREPYEMLRARDLPMICYAAAAEASHCLLIDPASSAPTMMVAYGP